MKIWIRIVENTQPTDDLGVCEQVELKLMPTEDRRGLCWELARPVRPGFHITHADEYRPPSGRAGGDGE